MSRQSWVQDPDTGKLVPKDEWNRQVPESAAIMGDIEPFISPIDGSAITSRSKLRTHNTKHGVTNSRDYSSEYMQKRSGQRITEMTGRTPQATAERRELLKRELDKHG